ncbi:MAG: hypothetical protein FJ256_01155 [Phycisphaerae bacterium]|nr:hypothetical protein [Phycisphaerae bacterium]
MSTETTSQILRTIESAAREARVFGAITRSGGRLVCAASGSASAAEYALEVGVDGWRLSLRTADRWLSESIESSLVESRDSIEDLFREALLDLGSKVDPPRVKHFRDDAKRYVFETVLPADGSDAEVAARLQLFLLAFESMFRLLGDMDSEPEG